MPAGYPYRRLYMNFVRLLDQSVREYDAARDEWITFLTPETRDGPRRGNAPCGTSILDSAPCRAAAALPV
jgi:hypothetical protein